MTAPPKRKMLRRNSEQRRRWSRNANAAKARKRLARPLPDYAPRMERFDRFEFRVRDPVNSETSAWLPIRSGRAIARQVATLLRFYA